MNKNIIVLLTGLLLSGATYAQKAKLNTANKTLQQFEQENNANLKAGLISKAQIAINEAIEDPSTATNADVWYTRAKVYAKASTIVENNAKEIQIGSESLAKALELNPKIASKNDDYNLVALELAIGNYNVGLAKFNAANYSEAYTAFGNVSVIAGEAQNKKMTEIYPMIDTIRSYSYINQGLSALNSENYENAKIAYEKALKDPITDKEKVIQSLIEIYEKLDDKTNQLKYIDMAVKQYPNNGNFANSQINYYIANNMTPQLIESLESAAKANPQDPQYIFRLGLTYTDLAEKATEASKKTEHEAKAEEYYKKTLELAGDNPMYNQQLGVHYFNKGIDKQNFANKDENRKSNAKYSALITERDNLFKTAEQLFEKAVAGFDKMNLSSMTGEQKESYHTSLQALGRIYASQNNNAKQQEVTNKAKTIK